MKILFRLYVFAALVLLLSGCYKIKGSYGGPQSFEPQPRALGANDVPCPTGITLDEQGTVNMT
ncbi:hypothetical protein [Rufibacter sp. XAAS-G3-1]|uniref:hypothetical protein n=1 Tax=Rufibacter sp. XAAS-G3-1 TaxID=2729134 RepID=UPI0015E770AE|nr:hypothetical protein [Rufibacter sp. XAAS-G3-1]